MITNVNLGSNSLRTRNLTRSSAIAVTADRTACSFFNAIHCDRNISTSE